MALSEVDTARRYLFDAIDRLVGMTEGVNEADLNWQPAPDANSLFVLATHVLGATEEGLINTLCAVRPSTRDRDAEFAAEGGSTSAIASRWHALRSELDGALDAVTRADLDATVKHPRRGDMSGYEALLMTATHAYEHLAHAELTKQLLAAR